jgi:hypothetical protein
MPAFDLIPAPDRAIGVTVLMAIVAGGVGLITLQACQAYIRAIVR